MMQFIFGNRTEQNKKSGCEGTESPYGPPPDESILGGAYATFFVYQLYACSLLTYSPHSISMGMEKK